MQRMQTKIKKEMEIYETFSTPSKTVNVLLWWKRHQNVLPILSKLSRMVLAIPASSAKSERVFSTGGNIVTFKRTRLNPKKVEELIIIKENEVNVEHFKDNTDYEIKVTGNNSFKDINLDIYVTDQSDVGDKEESDEYDTDIDENEIDL